MDGSRDLTLYIKGLLLEEGFDLVGVTDPEVPSYAREAFIRWLEEGMHADMEYMERWKDKRLDMGLLWKDVRSVVVVGKSYYVDWNPDAPYRIARYAWGKDYHKVMKKKLLRVGRRLKRERNIEFRAYVDTGPILEKVFGQKAGLGWQGRNSLLINPRMGSYFFLGVLLLDVELEMDSPFAHDFCGKCDRCVQSCPTGAIDGSRMVDSRKCISYWTIEYRGSEIPDYIVQKMDSWLFGCDICQEVCPWNSKARATDWQAFRPREEIFGLSIYDIARMSEEEWKAFSRASAIKRAGLEGIRRNAEAILKGRSG